MIGYSAIGVAPIGAMSALSDSPPEGIITADLVLPMIKLNAKFAGELITADLTLPMPTLDAGFGMSAELMLPMLTLVASGHDSTGENSFHGILPMIKLVANFGGRIVCTLPMLTLDAKMTGEALISVELTLPMLTLDAMGVGSPYIITADLRIPMLTLVADFGAGLSITLPMLTLYSSMTTGSLVTANLRLPMLVLDAQVTRQNMIWADLTLPMLVPASSITADLFIPMLALDAQMTAVVAVSYEAYSVNLTHVPGNPLPVDEVTHYTNFPFTHIVRYQNGYFAASADGLYLLEGETDNGKDISYALKTCMDDFKAPNQKTVASAYLAGRIGASITVTVHTGETDQTSYDYSTLRGPTATNHREKFGRGVKDRYFALGLSGNGALELDSIELEINKLTRRI